jgi:hypothetical protein
VNREDNHEMDAFDLDEVGGSAGVFFVGGDVAFSGVEKRPIKEIYAVFSRPRNDADRQAGVLAVRWGALDMGTGMEDDMDRPPGVTEEEWRASLPGKVLEEEGRLLLQGLGGEEDMVYAAPTENDHICHALLPNGGGGCGAPGPDGLNLQWAYSPSTSLVVYGLVGDEIAAVDILIAGETHAARMGENAFGIRVDGTKPSQLESVVLRRRDGTTNRLPLGFGEGMARLDDE